jgi:DUF1365 family protein
MAYLDLDELETIRRTVWPFSVNRWNLWSFFDRDHIDGRAGSTRDKLLRLLGHYGIDLTGGRVGLLTQCRTLGYVFNPISLFYCRNSAGSLVAVVAEVHNTFGERHLYLLSQSGKAMDGVARFRAAKEMHVSPFITMACSYDFTFAPLGERLSVGIVQHEGEQQVLSVSLWGNRLPMTNRVVAGLLMRYPLVTIKTISAIHAEALRLYWKGVPVVSHPGPSPAHSRQQALLDVLDNAQKEDTDRAPVRRAINGRVK